MFSGIAGYTPLSQTSKMYAPISLEYNSNFSMNTLPTYNANKEYKIIENTLPNFNESAFQNSDISNTLYIPNNINIEPEQIEFNTNKSQDISDLIPDTINQTPQKTTYNILDYMTKESPTYNTNLPTKKDLLMASIKQELSTKELLQHKVLH